MKNNKNREMDRLTVQYLRLGAAAVVAAVVAAVMIGPAISRDILVGSAVPLVIILGTIYFQEKK